MNSKKYKPRLDYFGLFVSDESVLLLTIIYLFSCLSVKLIHDIVIMRTIIDLPESQVNALAELCKSQSISRAEAIRRALSEMLSQQRTAEREAAFGAWKDKKVNSREFVDALRSEW